MTFCLLYTEYKSIDIAVVAFTIYYSQALFLFNHIMMDRKILSDAEVEALFETHNISDIKQLHSELERDIDKKREELRTTVGERYRDLMEAAETITRMKTTSNDVVHAFKNIAETTVKFDYYPTTATQHLIRETEQETKKDINPEKKENLNESDLAVAAEIKLLMDSPEMIWSAVDNGDYLTAAQVFLFARHIHTNLTFQSNAVCHLFPIIERQWSSILPFYDTILSGCLQLMGDGSHIFGAETYNEENLLEELNTTKVVRAMATIILLKGISMKDLFMEFLGLRETSIKKKIFAEEHSAKNHIRNTIISVVSCIKSCVAFCSTGNTKDNIESILNDVAEKPAIRLYQNVSVSPVMKYLPSIIKDFCPSVVVKKDPLTVSRSNEDSRLTEEYLQLECTNWLDRVHDMISEGTAKVLSHVNTLGGISIIRRGVYDFLSYSESKDNSTSLVEDWNSVCLSTIKRNVNIWDEFYRNLFRDRVEELITKEIEKAVQYLKEKIESPSSQSSELETAEFIWSEPNISDARIDRTSEKDQAVKTFTALELKARSYSPSVQAICEKFDAMLQALMYDLGAYVKSDNEDENISPTKFSRENYSFLVDESSNDECRSNRPFLLEQDHNAILRFVEDSTLKTVSEMLESITLKVKEEMRPDCTGRSDCYVFMARICQAVPELCPSLESCASASSKLQSQNALEAFPGNDYLGELKHLSNKNVKTKYESNAKLRKVYEHFFETCTFLLISWVNSLGIVLKNEIKLFLSNDKEANLSLLPQWEKIEIAEENEEGKQIKSTIRVPNQISVGLYQALCQHVNAIYSIGSHNLPSQGLYLKFT